MGWCSACCRCQKRISHCKLKLVSISSVVKGVPVTGHTFPIFSIHCWRACRWNDLPVVTMRTASVITSLVKGQMNRLSWEFPCDCCARWFMVEGRCLCEQVYKQRVGRSSIENQIGYCKQKTCLWEHSDFAGQYCRFFVLILLFGNRDELNSFDVWSSWMIPSRSLSKHLCPRWVRCPRLVKTLNEWSIWMISKVPKWPFSSPFT